LNIKNVYGVFSLGSAMLVTFRILQIIFSTDLVTGFSEGIALFDIIFYVTFAVVALLICFISFSSQGYKGLEEIRLSKMFAVSSVLLAIVTAVDAFTSFNKKSDALSSLYYIELLCSLVSVVALIYVAYGIFSGHTMAFVFKICFVLTPILYTSKLVVFFYEFSSISGVFSVLLSIIGTAVAVWFLFSIANLFLGNVSYSAIKKTIALGLLSTVFLFVISMNIRYPFLIHLVHFFKHRRKIKIQNL
jgi:hypothetical protein